jgi:hypothetical protein
MNMEDILQYFECDHLPKYLAEVSYGFRIVAHNMLDLPKCAERSAGLRKLLEAKDCAVRAAIKPKG